MFPNQPNSGTSPPPSSGHGTGTGLSMEELTRVFNTALVSTRSGDSQDFSAEIYALVESAPFRAILGSVRQLARTEGTNEREAAESLIQTFRKIDRIWGEYLFQEGIDRLKNQMTPG